MKLTIRKFSGTIENRVYNGDSGFFINRETANSFTAINHYEDYESFANVKLTQKEITAFEKMIEEAKTLADGQYFEVYRE